MGVMTGFRTMNTMGGPRTRLWLREAGDLPWRWRCTSRQQTYDPSEYRLTRVSAPPPLEAFLADMERQGGQSLRSAEGIVWSRTEFLAEQWVEEWVAEGTQGECFRDLVFARYGERIPVDLAVIDAHAHDFLGIETIDREASWVHEMHVHTFAGIADLGTALHRLYAESWITPLTDGTVVAPRLRLSRGR